MAKEILNAIYNAEEECKARENDANLKAQEQIDKAKKDADELIKKAENNALNEADELLDKARLDSDKELENAKKEASEKCLLISETASKNRENVINLAVNMLLN